MSLRRVEECRLAVQRARRGGLGADDSADGCIWDGACLRACPDGGAVLREFRDDVDHVRGLIGQGRNVVVSLAPSYVAAFGGVAPGQVISALRSLGFSHVEETACALGEIVQERARYLAQSTGVAISTSCPSAVYLIRNHYPHALPFLLPLPSPMMAHGARLRERYGPEAAIVFIGPCLAKKHQVSLMRPGEATRPVDFCLTFAELKGWISEMGIDLRRLPTGRPDADASSDAKLGLLQEGISGIENCVAFLERLVSGEGQTHGAADGPLFVELLACPGGCLDGPGMGDEPDEPDELDAPAGAGGADGADWDRKLAVRRTRAALHALGRL